MSVLWGEGATMGVPMYSIFIFALIKANILRCDTFEENRVLLPHSSKVVHNSVREQPVASREPILFIFSPGLRIFQILRCAKLEKKTDTPFLSIYLR